MAESGVTLPNESSGELMTHEQKAWVVLLSAFAVFVILAVSIPLATTWYIENATIAQLATASGTSGTTLIELPGGRDPVGVVAGALPKEDLVEGSVIRTDSSSQAQLSFFDRSTLTIFPNSTVTIGAMRRPRFGYSSQPDRIVVTVDSGRVRAQVAPWTIPALHFEIQAPQALAPHGGIVLEAGSYAIETSNRMTHVSVRSGGARVSGQTGQAIQLEQNERAEIALGTAATGPLPAKRNLLDNSDFLNPEVAIPISNGSLVSGWMVVSDEGGDGASVNGTAEVVTTGTSRALHFVRTGSNQNHGETGVVQTIDQHIADYLSLLLRLDVKVVYQSLSGGGEQSSEFPLIVRVDYKDVNGNNQHWTHGFYVQNDAGFNILNGTQIPANTFYPYEIDLKEVLVDPIVINSIRIYASGWDWDVFVSEVALIAE